MYDFRDVAATSKTEQIRAWSVEQAVEAMTMDENTDGQDVVETAKLIEDYVLNGKD